MMGDRETESVLDISPLSSNCLLSQVDMHDESISSHEFDLKETDSTKKVTMVSLNEKLMCMWDFMQHQKKKQKAERKQTQSKLDQTQNKLDQSKNETAEMKTEMKDRLDSHTERLFEAMNVQTRTVHKALDEQNHQIKEVLHNQKEYFDEQLTMNKEDNLKRFKQLELNVSEINLSLSEQDKRITEINSQAENAMLKTRTQLNEMNSNMEKLFMQSNEQNKTNHKLTAEVKKAESLSEHVSQKCSNIEVTVKRAMQKSNEQIHNEIDERFKEFSVVHKELNGLSVRMDDLQERINTEVVPPAEKWNVRNGENVSSDSDVDQRVSRFHEKVHSNKSVSCKGNVPWNLESDCHVSREASPVFKRSLNHVRSNSCVNGVKSGVSFMGVCSTKDDLESIPRSFSEEVDMNRKQTIPLDDGEDNKEIRMFAQMMSKIVAKSNNVQLPVFDGMNSDLASYKRQCLAVARQNEWSSVDLAIRIVSSLQGDARSLMNLLPVGQEYELDCIWNILKSRFDRPLSPEVAKNQLANIVQKKGETFLHLSLQIEKLINRAYPLANEPMKAQLVMDHFIKAIASSAVRYEIRLRNPRDINQAKQWAEEISVIQASEKFQRMTYVNKISCKDKNEEVDGSSSAEDLEEKKKKKKKKNRSKESFNMRDKNSVQAETKMKVEQQYKESIPVVSEQQGNQRPEHNSYVQGNFEGNFKTGTRKDQPQPYYRQSYGPRQQYGGEYQRYQSNGDERQQYQVNRGRTFRNNSGNGERGCEQQDVRRGGFVNRGGQRGQGGWFNRENLRNMYYGKDGREGKDRRISHSVSRM